MSKSVVQTRSQLKQLFEECCPPLLIRQESDNGFTVVGRRPVQQEGKEVDGHHFARVEEEGSHVNLSFFPLYTHPAYFDNLSDPLLKARKSDHSFHFKKLDDVMEKDLREMIETGVRIYGKEGLL